MDRASAVVSGTRGANSLKGRKVPPKDRGASGETCSGRGAKPRWLVAAMKNGKKLDYFLIGGPEETKIEAVSFARFVYASTVGTHEEKQAQGREQEDC